MNGWEREDLRWLLESSSEELDEFYDWATMDDLDYALHLVRQGLSELHVAELEVIDDYVQETNDTSAARAALSKWVAV